MLALSKEDIKREISPENLISAVASAMQDLEKELYNMPQRMHVNNRESTLLLMPCFTEKYFSTKLVSLFPGNRNRNLSVLQGLVILNSNDTGEPMAIMDGALITALRTGAAGAVGIRETSDPRSSSIGIVGAGVQGFYQAIFSKFVRNIKKVNLFDKFINISSDYISKLKQGIPEADIKICHTSEELLENSEIVVTATCSKEPVLPDKPNLLKNKSFIAIGSYKPDMREIPKSLFPLINCCYIDVSHAAKESGDLIFPLETNLLKKEKVLTLGSIIHNNKSINQTSTTLFKSVGCAAFDLVAAKKIYEEAITKGFGKIINL